MSISDKIVTHADLANRLKTIERPMVFTNGVFDILHPGHIDYLDQARGLGGSLVIGLNADSSVRMLGKGADRPINSESDRAVMLAALESVSLVTFFSERTPLSLLYEVRPDIYVKGGDYEIDTLEEARFVRSYRGEARVIPFREGYSTTSFLDRIRLLG